LKDQLTFEVFYPYPPEKVWQALTDPDALGQWLLPTDFEPRLGFRFSMGEFRGEVLELDEPRRLRYSWEDGEAGSASVITWELQPKDGGTLLRLEHEATTEVEPYVLIEAYANWRGALGRLYPPVPIVYEEENDDQKPRAGFREEETACR
jgi:uncharacterized protein YndB with AHSA1/START domain